MASGKNYNIQTKQFRVKGTTGSAVSIGGAVPAGMNRYVTFISVRQNSIARGLGSKIWFASAATSQALVNATSTLVNASQKFAVRLISAYGTDKVFAYPKSGPDPENPLFSVAASKFLVAQTTSTAAGSSSCTIFIQYYDQ